jgi:hypothetical protein
MNLLTLALIAIVVVGLPTLYFAWRSREFRKFLAGAFFVSAGIQFYLYLAKVSVPLLYTSLVLTPEVNGLRSIPHFIFFWVCLYFGFIKKPQGSYNSLSSAAPRRPSLADRAVISGERGSIFPLEDDT